MYNAPERIALGHYSSIYFEENIQKKIAQTVRREYNKRSANIKRKRYKREMFSRIDIKKLAGTTTYTRGLNLYEDGYVLDLEIQRIDEYDKVIASVHGSGRKIYEVDISVNMETEEPEDYFCECPAFMSYDGICKHCVAAMLKYLEEQDDSVTFDQISLNQVLGAKKRKKRQTSPELAALFQKQALVRSLPLIQNETYGKVRLEPSFSCVGGSFDVEFKIGVSRMYVMRDVLAFAGFVEKEEDHEYGKSLRFIHAKEAFEEQSRPLVDFVLRWAENYRQTHRRYSYYGYYTSGYEKMRSITLKGHEIEDYLLLYEGKKIRGGVAETRCGEWFVTTEKLPRTLTITGTEDGIELKVTKFAFGGSYDRYRIIFHEGKIYLEDKKKLAPALDFLDSMTAIQGTTAFIEKKDVPVFCKNYLPVLQDYFKIRKSHFAPEDYEMELAKIKVYLDAPQRDMITAKPVVVFEKGELSIYTTEQLTERNMEQELHVREILDRYSNAFDSVTGTMVISGDEERIYEFLVNAVPALHNLAEVYISDALKRMEVQSAPKVSIGVSLGGNMLELKLTAGDLSREELIDILSRYNRKKKFYRLKNGAFVSAENSGLDTVAELKEGLQLTDRQLQQEDVSVPKYRAMYLDAQLRNNPVVSALKDKSFRSLIRNMKTVEDNDFEVPTELEPILREYQKKGFLWLKTLQYNGFGGILADDMGLGKTLQVIAFLVSCDREEEKKEGIRSALIVSPASLVYNWSSEFRKFAPGLPVRMVTGSAAERAQTVQDAGDREILITSYDLLKRDLELYKNLKFAVQVIDEAQMIKNHTTQAAKAVKGIEADFKLALTGTPVENRLSELWSIFDYLMPGFLYSYQKFHEELENPIVQNSDETVMKRLQKMISPFVLRRLKKDVLTDLPDKLEETMVAQLSGEQQKLYDAHVKRMMLMLDKQSEEEFKTSKITILSEITKLRQLCCDPGLIYEDYRGESAKLEMCINMIKNAVEGGHKLLLFSQFTSMLDRIAGRLKIEKIGYYLLTGSTTKEKRAEMVEAFAEDSVPVFLISLKAGGTGLNLTAADMVIHFDPWWNLAVQNQATDRAHRIGQQNVVNVYKLVMKDTIEENILKLQEKKRELADQILGGEGLNGSSLTREDLLELLGEK